MTAVLEMAAEAAVPGWPAVGQMAWPEAFAGLFAMKAYGQNPGMRGWLEEQEICYVTAVRPRRLAGAALPRQVQRPARRLYTAIARHTVLVMAALAICAVTAALLKDRTDTKASPPVRAGQAPPPDPG